jgi:hypothetical protein
MITTSGSANPVRIPDPLHLQVQSLREGGQQAADSVLTWWWNQALAGSQTGVLLTCITAQSHALGNTLPSPHLTFSM